jgi:hypothetical protein
MIELKGNYLLKCDFGGVNVNINSQNIIEFTILQDINKFLPEIRVQFADPQGIMTHLIPYDKGMAKMTVQINKSIKGVESTYNDFDFAVFRRQPEGQFGPSAHYDIRGLMDMEPLFAPNYSRAWNQSIKTTVQAIATELGCNNAEISAGLDYAKLIIQPSCTTIELLEMLKRILIGSSGEGAFHIFVKRQNGRSTLVCKSMEDLFRANVKYKFIVNDVPVKDYFPIVDYEVMDNYKLFGIFGGKQQDYSYFDYYNSQFVQSNIDAQSFFSLTDYFLIDGDDIVQGDTIQETGSSNEFTRDFQNIVKANYYRRLNSLVKMWVMTWGLPNIAPGDVVQVLFAQGQVSGSLQSYQFSGYWLVERVVHMFSDTHRMRLLLTRNGVDTDRPTTLLKAKQKKT